MSVRVSVYVALGLNLFNCKPVSPTNGGGGVSERGEGGRTVCGFAGAGHRKKSAPRRAHVPLPWFAGADHFSATRDGLLVAPGPRV
jgi:hypothetical protein